MYHNEQEWRAWWPTKVEGCWDSLLPLGACMRWYQITEGPLFVRTNSKGGWRFKIIKVHLAHHKFGAELSPGDVYIIQVILYNSAVEHCTLLVHIRDFRNGASDHISLDWVLQWYGAQAPVAVILRNLYHLHHYKVILAVLGYKD